jgi:hypothetical protein
MLCSTRAKNFRQIRLRGRANAGQSQSTRTRLIQECINQVNVQQIEANQPSPPVCPVITPPPLQLGTTRDQTTYTLNLAVRCPIKYNTPFSTFGCQPVYTNQIPAPTEEQVPGVEPPQGPAVDNVLRQFPRIGGIEEICKPLVGRAASDRTARLRVSILSQSNFRYVQTEIPLIPYPPCPIPRRPGPQPGVPVPPNGPCNLGERRVDYSNPNA